MHQQQGDLVKLQDWRVPGKGQLGTVERCTTVFACGNENSQEVTTIGIFVAASDSSSYSTLLMRRPIYFLPIEYGQDKNNGFGHYSNVLYKNLKMSNWRQKEMAITDI